eukprot:226180-Pyramimonas_sp.AAC.1
MAQEAPNTAPEDPNPEAPKKRKASPTRPQDGPQEAPKLPPEEPQRPLSHYPGTGTVADFAEGHEAS